jgi:RNA-directed DNA polymerase
MINTLKHLSCVLGFSEQNLSFIIDNIDQYYYNHSKPKTKYGEFQRDKKGNVKYRKLCSCRYPLKTIQQRIHNFLLQIELPEYAYGGVPGRNNILNARQHRNNKYFFSADLKDFFPNINHRHVFRMFRQNNFSPTVSRVLTQLTTYKGCLQQGPPTSPIIANLVFVNTGNKLQEVIKDRSITFTSFYDDLSFSSKKDFKFITRNILEIVKSDGFYINHKKVSYKASRPEVTGTIIHKNKLLPIPKMKEKAKKNSYLAAYINSFSQGDSLPF